VGWARSDDERAARLAHAVIRGDQAAKARRVEQADRRKVDDDFRSAGRLGLPERFLELRDRCQVDLAAGLDDDGIGGTARAYR
jgi:hypothetical protein